MFEDGGVDEDAPENNFQGIIDATIEGQHDQEASLENKSPQASKSGGKNTARRVADQIDKVLPNDDDQQTGHPQ